MKKLIVLSNHVLVVVPTYNCRKQTLELLEEIFTDGIPENTCIWFIDNLSTDGTNQASSDFIKVKNLKNVHSFQTLQNNNLGGTHKIGFNEATSNSFEYVAIFHGDNQASYKDLVSLIELCQNNDSKKSYLGSRFSRKSKLIGYSLKRKYGNIVLNLIYSIFKLRILTDLGSGLNMYLVADLKRVNYMNFSDSLTFNYELLLEMIDQKMKFEYVPITWRETDQISNAKNIRIFLSGIGILFRNKFLKRKIYSQSEKVYGLELNKSE